MTSMTSPTTRVVIGGVDTHGQTHHAAVIDEVGRQLSDREFTASPVGYRALADWLGEHGILTTDALLFVKGGVGSSTLDDVPVLGAVKLGR